MNGAVLKYCHNLENLNIYIFSQRWWWWWWWRWRWRWWWWRWQRRRRRRRWWWWWWWWWWWCLILIIQEGGLCVALFHWMRLVLYFSNRILSVFTKYHCSPVFHTRSLDSFYMNTNLNGISMIHQGIWLKKPNWRFHPSNARHSNKANACIYLKRFIHAFESITW